MLSPPTYDAVIIGAGLSGLACGIRLQKLGIKTLIVEQASEPGGLCHSVNLNGLIHEVGCNDFGRSIEKQMAELGVFHPFKKVKTRFIFADQQLDSPFSASALLTFLQYPLDLVRLLVLMRRTDETKTLPTITDQLHNLTFRNMIHTLLAYLSFRPVEQISIGFAKRLLSSAYGYDDPRVPIGGTRPLINAMRLKYEALGGTIRLETQYVSKSDPGPTTHSENIIVALDKLLTSETDSVETKVLVSSYHGWEQYPADAQPSLSAAALLVKMDSNFTLPKDIHTFIFSPPNIGQFLSEHERGSLSDQFGFHWFRHYPTAPGDSYALTAYVLWPRDLPSSDDRKDKVVQHVMTVTNEKFPGFSEAVQGAVTFVMPDQYEKNLGIRSCLAPRLILEPLKLACYNAKANVFQIGNPLNPPEDQHAGGALDSAKEAVAEITATHFKLPASSYGSHSPVVSVRTWGDVALRMLLTTFGCVSAISLLSYAYSGDALSPFRGLFPFWQSRLLAPDTLSPNPGAGMTFPSHSNN